MRWLLAGTYDQKRDTRRLAAQNTACRFVLGRARDIGIYCILGGGGVVRRLFNCVLACCLLLTGCATIKMPETMQPTPTPEVMPMQELAPVLQNPVEAFWNDFQQACEPYLTQMDAQTDVTRVEALDKSLALELQMQRLQQLFYALTSLGQSGDDATGWSGILLGGMEGTGSIRMAESGYAFSCTLADSATLAGTLQNDSLYGEWTAQDREPRTGEIIKAENGWYAITRWEDAACLLYVNENGLYFAKGVQAIPDAAKTPADWAQWSYQSGLFTEFDKQPEVAEEESD